MAALTLSHGIKPTLLNLAPRLTAFSSLFRPAWSMPCEPSTSSASLQVAQEQSSWMDVIPSLSSLWELLPPLVLTTPKKKTSRARRGKGMENKWLRNRTNIEVCTACGHPHLAHSICHNCFSQISRRWKAEARGDRPRVHDPAFEEYVPGTKWGGPSAPAS